jgi:TonB family protein
MNFFSDPQETASRFGDTIEDFHDVFRCNGVDFGSRDDFFAFARTMKYHSDLRGDVMRVVKSVMESETNVSFRTILTIIAVASGGPDVATSDREMSTPVSLVIESLIGAGACSQLNSEHPDVLCLDLTEKETAQSSALDTSSPRDREAAGHTDALEHKPGHTGVEETFEKVASDSSSDSSIDGGPANSYGGPSNDSQYPSNDYGASNTLAESLTRLELNGLQLKIYLDSIEQRISRMEPRLEKVAPLVLSAPAAHAREETGVRFSATIPPESEPEPPHNDLPVSSQPTPNQEDRAAIAGGVTTEPPAVLARLWKDSQQFYSSRRQIAFPILVGVPTVLLAASLFWRFGRDTGYVVIRPVNASVEGAVNGGGVTPHAASAVSDSPGPPVRAAQGNSSTVHQALKKSAQIPLRSPSALSSMADAETAPMTATETSESVAPSDRAYRLSSEPLSDRRVDVSSDVMAANLMSDPKPSYPTLASLTRTQGNVVMQAVISKDGSVEQLRVIKGHRLLRGAAKNAVRNWRYRPYKIDGVPVEVATTVSVDFTLRR